ncbi:glutathione-dependent disulfide-bond oxidoreductase [Tetragenococcus koreensis]|uniref:Glutathione S-transferase n=1 Tax=Tetragenococcus koreensis TaxID=290335 RepID=A0AAN4RJL2_9ENTE|nr:glutathione-dependent disulfide-bond oxidoreductase [Tetragenococcus koreensis]MDN6504379.1 glutathione-dependent disulfide-bond oxidoreductase [Tetragenococcus halophilus]AYW45934.1 glutathione-dependent disulfide-bond oxidoreductase [Tetragenococcus koreensis]MCF1621371.1 glutathione-dependent disulfide-bond oxidoreductase [Tetragenococcus koreensis]MCF1626379.1 glutathione-dependent disulfide-bond oxidoreductase [Tetragenococcus koreensis]MCF1631060.1 glutathione-dependent disulfide-bond
MSDYTIPKVWEEKQEDKENKLGNQPVAGSRFEQKLPAGGQPLQVYSLGTPNGIKVTIMLEELKEAGVDAKYDLFKIAIGEGDQFGSDFVKINPNSKIPAMVDYSHDEPIRVFESVSILLYLAEKFEKFMPTSLAERTELMNWLFWQTGAAPFVGGGFGHFYHYAPFAQEYPIDRYTMETKRQLDLLDKHLANKNFINGDEYTIADMAIWPWYGQLVQGELYGDAAEFLNAKEYKNVIAWADRIAKRPAVKRAKEAEYKDIN